MATSSITKNFIVSGTKQAEIFAEAIESSYQESLNHTPTGNDLKIRHLSGADEIRKFMMKRKKSNA